MTRSTFSVPEIVCDGCAASIRRALNDLAGIGAIDVDVAAKKVHVEFDEGRASPADVRERIEAAGFDVE